jgi:hypothetical protein
LNIICLDAAAFPVLIGPGSTPSAFMPAASVHVYAEHIRALHLETVTGLEIFWSAGFPENLAGTKKTSLPEISNLF